MLKSPSWGILPAFLLAIPISSLAGFVGPVVLPSKVGSPYQKASNTSAMNTKTIVNSYYQPGTGPGSVVHGVNTFTGQPSYSIPLGSINCRGTVAFPLVLGYGGPVAPVVKSNNDRAPTGWLGLGFGMNFPYVATNHKGTFTFTDDVYFCNLGPFGGGQLLRNPSTGEYFLASDPTVRIEPQLNSTLGSALNGQIEAWIFTLADGTKLYMGQKDDVVSDNERTLFYGGSLVNFSPRSPRKPYIYRWDAWKITDNAGVNAIHFTHQKLGYDLGGSTVPTTESYPSTIRILDRNGQEIEGWSFHLGTKTSGEWVGGSPTYLDFRFTETRYLSEMRHSYMGGLRQKYTFQYSLPNTSQGVKRILTGIGVWEQGTNVLLSMYDRFKMARQWQFQYDAAKDFLLATVTRPDGGTDAYSYVAATATPESQQDTKVYTSKILLSTVPTAKFKNNSFCDERFCYLMVKEGGNADSTHLQVIPHTGTYFDTNTANHLRLTASIQNQASKVAGAQSIDVIPRGDDLLWLEKSDNKLTVYTWNGVKFVNTDAFSWPGAFGPNGGIEVHASQGYFLVWKKGISGADGKAKVYIYMKDPATGRYKEINTGLPAGTCLVDNPAYGSPVKDAGDGCMTFKDPGGKLDQLMLAINGPSFTIVHKPTGTFYAYTLNMAGNGFDNFSATLPKVSGTTFQTANLNRWNVSGGWTLDKVFMGSDYLVVKTKGSQHRLDFFHFDGAQHWHFGSPSSTLEQDVRMGPDYFLTISRSNRQVMYYKQVKSLNAGTPVTFTSSTVLPSVSGDQTNVQDYLVRAYPDAFTVELWGIGKLTSQTPDGVPLIDAVTKNYKAYQFKIENGIASQIPAGVLTDIVDASHPSPKLGLCNVSFSVSDPLVMGMSLRRSDTKVICPENTACDLSVYTGQFNTFASGMTAVTGLKGVPFNRGVTYLQLSHVVASGSSRIGMMSVLDKTSRNPFFQLYAYNGANFVEPDAQPWVVNKVTSSAGLDNNSRNVVTWDFAYNVASAVPLEATNPPFGLREFNIHSQTVQNSNSRVTQTGVGGSHTWYQLDYLGDPKYGSNDLLFGNVYRTAALDHSFRPLSINTAHFAAAYCRGTDITKNPPVSVTVSRPWPPSLVVRRADSLKVEIFDPRGNKKTSVQWMPVYNDNNGQPFFTVKENKRNTDYTVNQTLFNLQELPVQSISYRLATKPANLATTAINPYANPPTTPRVDIPFLNTSVAASTKLVWDPVFRYLRHSDSAWRDVDETLTEAQLKAGQPPAFKLNENWFEVSRINARNEFGQPLEVAATRSQSPRQERFGTFFYEGPRSDQIGAVSNAPFTNCTIFSAEDGLEATGSYHDRPGQWLKQGSVNSPEMHHSGSFSVRVTDATGPRGIIIPKGVAAGKFGYRVSAWFLARASAVATLKVERRSASGALVQTHTGVLSAEDPVGWPQTGIWQRWEVNLTYAQLTANGLFQSSANDYLQISAGTGPATGDPSRVAFVDDIVCIPDNASFTLTGYDVMGLPVSVIDSHHRMKFLERDTKGALAGFRDDKYRMIRQTGFNWMGENP